MIVLLVVEGFDWIFGQMAEAICQHNPDISFIYTDVGLLTRDPDEFQSLVKQSDVVHWITNAANAQPLDVVNWSLTNFPSVASLYHITGNESYKVATATSASVIHVMSTEWRDYLVDRAKVPLTKVRVVPLGVDTTFYTFSKKNTNHQKIFRIGCFGNPLAPNNRKGVDVLRGALSLLDKTKFQMVFAGPGWETVLSDIKFANIEFNGFVDKWKLRELYYSLNAYVIPSRVEGGPVTLLEAFSTGVPVVSTSVGMSKDLINHGENGYLIPKDSPDALARQIQELRENKYSLGNIKIKARADVEKYDWKFIAPLYGDLYKQLFTNHTRQLIHPSRLIEFKNKKMLPEQQRKAILAEKRYNRFTTLMKQRNYRTGIFEFLSIPLQYWPGSILRAMRGISKL